MTYFGFLVGFVIIPIVLLSLWQLVDRRSKELRSRINQNFHLFYSFIILTSLALVYTTPWDNYLVASGVWWYDPDLVLGFTFGWVPLEEYLFFVLQPILGGLLLLVLLRRRLGSGENEPLKDGARKILPSIAITIWATALTMLVLGIPAATYLGLELVWALPVIILQLVFGADILWKYRSQLFAVILGLTIFLSLGDAIAIQSGIWTINPEQSLGLLLAGILPVEEFIFFLLTNIMVGFGFVLIWSPESQTRIADLARKIKIREHISNLRSEL
ncbi:MAG: lycopene cyclase domain-containing protein [Anaerolineales bacterium]